MRIIHEPSKYHQYAFEFKFSIELLEFCRWIKRTEGWQNFGFWDKKWRFTDTKIIDIDRQILPNLTIIDAYRILTRNGPIGGNLADVKLTKALISSTCTVSADIVALGLFSHKLEEVTHLKNAVKGGLNRFDLNNLNIKKVQLT